jgi:hypothetical protein
MSGEAWPKSSCTSSSRAPCSITQVANECGRERHAVLRERPQEAAECLAVRPHRPVGFALHAAAEEVEVDELVERCGLGRFHISCVLRSMDALMRHTVKSWGRLRGSNGCSKLSPQKGR